MAPRGGGPQAPPGGPPLDGHGRRIRRAAVLALVACACGLLAASTVRDTIAEVESRTGAPVRVVVAREPVPEGKRLDRPTVRRLLSVREVPARYAPRDALADPLEALGLELAVGLEAGAYVTEAVLRAAGGGAARPAVPLGRGQRLVEVAVSGGAQLAAAGAAARVDVLVTKEGAAGGGRTFVALEDVPLVSARATRGGPAGTEESGPDTLATLRVGARAAVFLAAAENFAREVRLLARPPGDRRRLGRSEVSGAFGR